MTDLTPVDKTVKIGLLTYPTLYSDRMDVLRQLFITNGNGFEWSKTKDGYVLKTYDKPAKNPSMRYDDLDKDEADIAADRIKYSDSDVLDDLLDVRTIQAQRERILRQQCEQNIDLFSRMSVRDRMGAYCTHDMIDRSFSLEYSKLISPRNPWGKIEISHVRAMEELIKDLNLAFNQIHGLHYDNPYKGGPKAPEPSMYSRMPEHHQKLHDRLQEVRKLLSEQSGQLKRDAEMHKTLTSILEGTFEDDNNPV